MINHQENGTGIYPGKIHHDTRSLKNANNRTRFLNSFAGLPFNHDNRNIYNNIPANPQIAEDAGWEEMLPDESVYHQFGQNGSLNRKFIGPHGQNEVVFKKDGSIETDARNVGTFNYEPPTNKIGHVVEDVASYFVLGNGPKDTTSFGERVGKTVDAFPSLQKILSYPERTMRRAIDYWTLPRDYYTNHPKNR